jgi:hypothetical protein
MRSHKNSGTIIVLAALSFVVVAGAYSQDNTLTKKETDEGWKLLFDGTSTDKWKSASSESFPDKGWNVSNGELFVDNTSGRAVGGDIITKEQFIDFELSFDFKLAEGANSGLKYSVQKFSPPVPGLGSLLGPEYQILDDDRHPDAKAGRNGNRKLGSLYDLLPSHTTGALHPIGSWNTSRVVSKGDHVEHWLNGIKVLEYDISGEAYNTALQQSKFKPVKDFGKKVNGYILLQDHGNQVYYKNIKIRKL